MSVRESVLKRQLETLRISKGQGTLIIQYINSHTIYNVGGAALLNNGKGELIQ